MQNFDGFATPFPPARSWKLPKATGHVLNVFRLCHSAGTGRRTEQVIRKILSELTYGFDECLLKLILCQKNKHVAQTALRLREGLAQVGTDSGKHHAAGLRENSWPRTNKWKVSAFLSRGDRG